MPALRDAIERLSLNSKAFFITRALGKLDQSKWQVNAELRRRLDEVQKAPALTNVVSIFGELTEADKAAIDVDHDIVPAAEA